jgi:TRAP-type mannitol/chloroaromatic compound transport system permease small subunit
MWTLELNENLMVAVAFLGGAYCALVDGHIKVDVLYSRLGAKAKAWIDIASSIMGLGFVTVVVWQCYIFFLKLLKTGHISEGGAGWPYWPIMLVAVIGGCLFSLQLIAKLVKAIDAAAYPNKVNIED